jgi:hypothetical protein
MQFNPHIVVINRDNDEPVIERTPTGAGPDGRPTGFTERTITVGIIAMRALDGKHDADKGAKAEDIYERFILGSKICGAAIGETVDLDKDEVKLIKRLVSSGHFSPGVWGQVWAALEAGPAPAQKPKANGAAAEAPAA